MKLFTFVLALATAAQAHYNFPSMVYNGATTPAWAAVRQWTNYYTYQPVQDVRSLALRCNKDASTVSAASTLSVVAGFTLAFTVSPDIYHAGPALAYMAKVPSGKTAANWDGSGAVWFKIYQLGPQFGQALVWPTATIKVEEKNYCDGSELPRALWSCRNGHHNLMPARPKSSKNWLLDSRRISSRYGQNWLIWRREVLEPG